MLTYKTRAGDMIDDIVMRHYGALNPSMLRQVLDANPGLAEWSKLPVGVTVALPDIAQPASTSQATALWD